MITILKLLILCISILNTNSWAITPSAKLYKYAKEAELHHGRMAIIYHINPHFINPQIIILFEIMRLFYLESPFIMKESHVLGNYLGQNMNNKNVLVKTEIFIARIAFIYFIITF